MRKRIAIDGTPDEVKVSCPVWSGGKSGDHVKGLPITIGHNFRRLRAQQPDGGGAVQGHGLTNGSVWAGDPREGQQFAKPADDGARPHDAGRTESNAQGSVRGHEDRYPSHADPSASV